MFAHLISLVVLGVLLLSNTSALAQTKQRPNSQAGSANSTSDGPSEAETVGWLKMNLKSAVVNFFCSKGGVSDTTEGYVLATEGNDLIVQKTRTYSRSDRDAWEAKSTFRVSRSGLNSEVEAQVVGVLTGGCEKSDNDGAFLRLTLKCAVSACVTDNKGTLSNELVLSIDAENADRIVKAVTHLLKLGGARRPAF